MKTELNFNTTADTFTILEGKALEPVHPEKINITGNIKSPAAFLAARYGDAKGKSLQEVDKEKAIVIVDEVNMSIVLLLDANYKFGTRIEGRLLPAPELEQFCINSAKLFTREELIKIIRFNKRFFVNPESYEALLTAFQKLNVSINTEIRNESDTRGNKDLALKRSIEAQKIPLSFSLNVPVFKGFEPMSFPVEICIDVTDASVRFWFESPELAELIEIRKQEIFNEQLQYCEDFVVIHK